MFYDKRYANSGVHRRLPGYELECQYVYHKNIWKAILGIKEETMVIWENKLEVRLERHNRLGKYLGKTHFLALIDLLLTGTRKNV